MAAKRLKCRECATEYPLEARYVCSKCFGPLEVGYEHEPVTDVGEVRRRFFRSNGRTESRTEVVASTVLPTRRKAQVARAIERAIADLEAGES